MSLTSYRAAPPRVTDFAGSPPSPASRGPPHGRREPGAGRRRAACAACVGQGPGPLAHGARLARRGPYSSFGGVVNPLAARIREGAAAPARGREAGGSRPAAYASIGCCGRVVRCARKARLSPSQMARKLLDDCFAHDKKRLRHDAALAILKERVAPVVGPGAHAPGRGGRPHPGGGGHGAAAGAGAHQCGRRRLLVRRGRLRRRRPGASLPSRGGRRQAIRWRSGRGQGRRRAHLHGRRHAGGPRHRRHAGGRAHRDGRRPRPWWPSLPG